MDTNHVKRLLCLILLASLVSACSRKSEPTIAPFLTISDTAPEAQAADFKYNDCPFETPNDMPKDMVREIRCATLTVPQDWNQPEGEKIDVAVAIVKTDSDNPLPDPVLVLIGNPGIGLDFAFAMPFLFPTVSEARDFIIVDQRGTGYSDPSFTCPELANLPFGRVTALSQKDFGEQILQATQKCADSIQSRVADLSGYSTLYAAADMEALRQALGILQWNIFTFLDGSRLALTLMRNYPQGIRSVVMDSPIPPQANPYADVGASAVEALDRFFERCDKDEKCSEAYPRLKDTFYKLLDQLDEQPISMEVSDLNSGQREKINLDSEKLLTFMLAAINTGENNEALGEIPRLIFQLNAGKTEVATRLLGEGYNINLPLSPLNFWRDCKEELAFTSLEKVKQANLQIDPHLAQYFNTQAENSINACEPWLGPKVDESVNAPVSSAVPALLLAGEYNWSQPATWSEQAAKSLRNATVVEFSGDGQLVYATNEQADCSHRLVDAFVEKPDADLDTSCASQPNKITWITLP